jgi:hypothetical protein
MPFVQGQLRHAHLSIRIDSECAHCKRPLGFDIDSDLHYRTTPGAEAALVFIPLVDFAKLRARSIIDDF